MATREKPRLISEEPDAVIPENAGEVFGKPRADGIVHLVPFDIIDGEIGFGENGELCAVLTNGNRWVSLRFTCPMAMVVGEQLMQCASKMVKVH